MWRPYTYAPVLAALHHTEREVAVLTWDGYLMAAYPEETEECLPTRLAGAPEMAHPWVPMARVHSNDR
ncbi:hypothetical protein PLESTM_001847900, partial [Pleodorina starrii]